MATEKIKSRIQLKYDTLENWEKATNFIPYEGEICIYSDIPSLKVGDGETKINDLPFMGDELITDEEIQSLFNKKIFYFYLQTNSGLIKYSYEENMSWIDWYNTVYNIEQKITWDGSKILYENISITLNEKLVSGNDKITNVTYSAQGGAEPT